MKVFVETQRFDQWWFRIIAGIVIVLSLWPIFSFTSEAREITSEFWIVMVSCTLTIVLFVWLLFFLKLETKIDEQGVHYGFFPFNLKMKRFAWHEIESITVRKYSPIREYGGWGYRTGFGKKSGALNVKGNIGIQIVLKNHNKVLIGTQKERDAKSVLNSYSHKTNVS